MAIEWIHRFRQAIVAGFILSLGAVAVARDTTDKAGAPRGGLAIVFDASRSMCGFFTRADPRRVMPDLVRTSVGFIDRDAGKQVFLLNQKADAPSARRDLVEARTVLRTDSERLAESGAGRTGNCKPFDGNRSDIDLIFAPDSPTKHADTVLLVTDAQLTETDRERFVDGFVRWVESIEAGPASARAGFAYGQVDYDGRYYPIAERDKALRRDGYPLGPHQRPLFVFWFARSDRFMGPLREIVGKVAPTDKSTQDSGVQVLLPALSTRADMLGAPVAFAPPLDALVQRKPTVKYTLINSDRDRNGLDNCLDASVTASGIRVEARRQCRDNRALFDGVSSIRVAFKFAANGHLRTSSTSGSPEELAWDLTPKSFGASNFALRNELSTAKENRLDVSAISRGIDDCPEFGSAKRPAAASAADACTKRLSGKTFQADALALALVRRQQRLMAHALDELNGRKYEFVFAERGR